MVLANVEEIASGQDNFVLWVSIGFASEESSLDTLHIVCGREEDRFPGFQGLYFERLDQGSSDYDLASSVKIGASALGIEWKDKGCLELGFPPTVAFQIPNERLGDWVNAVAIFRQMAETPNGAVLTFDTESPQN